MGCECEKLNRRIEELEYEVERLKWLLGNAEGDDARAILISQRMRKMHVDVNSEYSWTARIADALIRLHRGRVFCPRGGSRAAAINIHHLRAFFVFAGGSGDFVQNTARQGYRLSEEGRAWVLLHFSDLLDASAETLQAELRASDDHTITKVRRKRRQAEPHDGGSRGATRSAKPARDERRDAAREADRAA